MKKILILSLMTGICAIHAQTIQIQQLDDTFNISDLPRENGNIIKPVKDLKALNNDSQLPNEKEMSELINLAGLADDIKTFDSFERDQICRRAMYFDENNLSLLYPQLHRGKLRKLIQVVKVWKNNKT